MKLTKKQLADLQEKAASGDKEAIKRLAEAAEAALSDDSDDEQTDLEETLRKKGKKAAASEEEVEEADDQDDPDDDDLEESDDPDDDDPDYDAELDDAIEEAKGETDDDTDDDAEDEDDDLEEADDDDLEEASDEDDEDARRKQRLLKSAKRQKQHAKTREAKGGNLNKTVRGKTGSGGATATKTAKQRDRQSGRGYPSSAGSTGIKTRESQGEAILRLSRSTDANERRIARLLEKNAHLSAQLRVRQTADRARKLLRESEIPEEFRPEVVPLLIGKNDREAQKVIRHYEKLFALTGSSRLQETDYDEIEGAGSRIREGAAYGEESDDIFEELGIPMKDGDD